MTITFKKLTVMEVIDALAFYLAEISEVKATIHFNEVNLVIIKLKRWGTTTLRYSYKVVPQPYLSTTLTLQSKTIAWAHKSFENILDRSVKDVVEKAGGTVTV